MHINNELVMEVNAKDLLYMDKTVNTSEPQLNIEDDAIHEMIKEWP